MDFTYRFSADQTLESLRGEIFRLYILSNKTASEVIATLKNNHDFHVSQKVLKTKLGQWNYTKNVKRSDVLHFLREVKSQQPTGVGEPCLSTLRQRPVNVRRIEKHRRRAQLPNLQLSPAITRTPLYPIPPPASPLLPLDPWRVSEGFLYDVEALIKGSFEADFWRFNGRDVLIQSSASQNFEANTLHNFLRDFALGCYAADQYELDRAGKCWREAFIHVEVLVKAQYHDIIPNLIQMINDLSRQGHTKLALILKDHIAWCGTSLLEPSNPARSIFMRLSRLELAFLTEIEERVMTQFGRIFELYLGSLNYSTFVANMDEKRRKLLRYPNTPLDCLPDLTHLDTMFGPTDRRCLDTIGTRIEIFHQRGMHMKIEAEASLLIRRAEKIHSDNWRRFYNLTRGYYFLGSARYFLRKREPAIECLSRALHMDDELCKIDEFHIFDTERDIIMKYLEDLNSLSWDKQEAGKFDMGLSCPLGPLTFFRCCKEPRRPRICI